MKISICSLAAAFALAAVSMTGCVTGSSETCSDKGACTDKSSCSADKAACCSTEKAAACCSAEKGAATASAAMVNTACPYSGGAAKATQTVAYEGKTVGFCCAGCVSKWESASDTDRKAMFAKVAAN